jgi:hypothetical protein
MIPSREERDAVEGRVTARSYIGDPDFNRLKARYDQFGTDAAKYAFADSWVRGSLKQFDRCWAYLYDSLAQIRDKEVYKVAHLQCDNKARASFEEYWADVVHQPFERFLNLEKTYKFLREHEPELLATLTYPQAKDRVLSGYGGDRRSDHARENQAYNPPFAERTYRFH